MIIVTSPFYKTSVLKTFSVHAKRKSGLFFQILQGRRAWGQRWRSPRSPLMYLSPSQWSRAHNWVCARFKHFLSLSRFITKFPRSTSATRAISVLSPIILPLQMFFSWDLLLSQQTFSYGNLPPERPTRTTSTIKTQVFMFRYEHVNSTRKFPIVAEIVTLLKKIDKRVALLELCLK